MAAYAQELRATSAHNYVDGFGYTYGGFTARALRLVGAADEFFPQDRVTIEVCRQPYVLPNAMLRTKADVLSRLESDAEQRKAPFFDGLHTRLVDYSIAGTDASTEQKRLTLHLGPIGWYDYSVMRWHTDQMNRADLTKYIDLEAIARTGSVVHTKLHNILDTATTLVTSDGYLLFAQRGTRVSGDETLLSSCVAENIHVQKDGSLSENANIECPAPFRAALRGIDEEMSPLIAQALVANGSPLFCLGLSFDLDAYHPDILFFAALSLTYEQVLKACRERPGQDFFEGHIRGVSLTGMDGSLARELSREKWTGGGKASALRALEFVETRALRGRQAIQRAIGALLPQTH